MAVIGRAFLELAANTTGFKASIEGAAKIADQAGQKLSKSGQAMVRNFENALNPTNQLVKRLQVLEQAGKPAADIMKVLGTRIQEATAIATAHGQTIPGIVQKYSEMSASAVKLGDSLTKSQRDAKDAINLLGNQIGVQLPREVEKFIASTSMIGPALAMAFKASIFIALAAALYEALTNMDKITDKLVDWSGAMKKAREDVADLNVVLLEHADALQKIERSNALIGLSGTARTKAEMSQKGGDLGDLLLKREGLKDQLSAFRGRAAGLQVNDALAKLTPQQVAAGIASINEQMLKLDLKIQKAEAEAAGLAKHLAFDQAEAGKKRLKELADLLDRVTQKQRMFFRQQDIHAPLRTDLQLQPGEHPFDFMAQIQAQAEAARRAANSNPAAAIAGMDSPGELFESVDSTWIKIQDQHRERYEKMIDTVRDGAGQVFDALLTKGKGAFSSLLNFVNGLMQTAGRKMFQNMAAMVFGGKKGGLGSIFEGVFPGFSGGGGTAAATGINGGTFGKLSGGLGGFFKNIFSSGGSTSAATASLGASGDWANSLNNVSQGKAMQAGGMGKMASGLTMAGMTAGMMLFQAGMGKGSKLMTTLGGAMTGASVGFQVGGPVGAAIGAGVGAVGGFVAGIFSSAAKRRREEITRIEESIKAYEALRAPTIGALGESLQGRGLSVGLQNGVRTIRWDRLEAAIDKLASTVTGLDETVMTLETLSPGVVVKRGADGASREILAAADQAMQNNRGLRLSFSRTVMEET